MTIAAAATAANNTVTMMIAWRRFGWVSSRVALGGCSGSTVVGPVARFIAELVVCVRMLVSISDVTGAEPSVAVPGSLPSDEDSLTSAVPSARQKTSASSVSRRLQAGQ